MTETPGSSSPDQPNQPRDPAQSPAPDQPQQPGWSSPDQPQQPQYQAQQYPQAPPPPGHYQQGPPPVTVKPGVIPLRPLGIGDILDGAIGIMRRHAKLIFGASAAVAVGTQLLLLLTQLPLIGTATDITEAAQQGTMSQQEIQELAQSALITAAITGGVSLILMLIGSVFLSGYLTVIAGHAVLGRPITFGQAWDEFKGRLLPLLGASVLYGLLLTVGLVLCIIPGIWLWVLFGLLTPALVLERCGIGAAFGRSKDLVKDAWWRTFGVLLLAAVIALVLNLVLSLPFEGAATALGGGFSSDPTAIPTAAALVVSAIGGIIASTITLPFTAAVTVLVYVDRRMRVEGLDIELQRAAGHGV